MNFVKISLFLWVNLICQTFTTSYLGFVNYLIAISIKLLIISFYCYLLKINLLRESNE